MCVCVRVCGELVRGEFVKYRVDCRPTRHPHLLPLAKDVKLGKYTVPTENRTPGPSRAVHIPTYIHTRFTMYVHVSIHHD